MTPVHRTPTRRRFLALAEAAVVGVAGARADDGPTDTHVETDGGRSADAEWRVVDAPTTDALTDVAATVAGPHAVGAGGDVLARRSDGTWERVIDRGPTGEGNSLAAVDATDDGRRIWFAGDSGVVGEYDATTGTKTDYSAPKEKTSSWEAVAATGCAGEDERLYLANGSGELLAAARRPDGRLAFGGVTKPGGGSTVSALDFYGPVAGYCCDTSTGVYATADGDSYRRIGVPDAQVEFRDVAAVAPDGLGADVAGSPPSADADPGRAAATLACSDGVLYRYDGLRWTPHPVGGAAAKTIRAVARDGDRGLAAGEGGYVYERRGAGEWTRRRPTEKSLAGVALSARTGSGPDVAVGEDGVAVERAPGGRRR